MKESQIPKKINIPDEKAVDQMKFDAHDTKTLKAAEKAEALLNIQKEILECKRKIEEINKDKTDSKLGERYGYSVDLVKKISAVGEGSRGIKTFGFSEKADKEIQELEDRIHELENSLKPKKRAIRKPKGEPEKGDDKDVSILEPKEPKETEEPKKPEETEKIKLTTPPPLPDMPKKDPPLPDDDKSRIEKRRLKLGVVLTDSVEKNSRDIASERMTADRDSLKGISGFFKKIWKHNWGAERNRVKEIEKIKQELATAGSAFSPDDISGVKDRAIKEAILSRFLEDSPELIHADAGEWKDTLVSPEKKAQAELDLQAAIRVYATASDPIQAEVDFKATRDRIYAGLFSDQNGSFNALDIADNVFEHAKIIREQVLHGDALADLDLDFELTFGEAKTGVRTEPKYSWTERVVKKIMSAPGGRFFNETILATAVSLVPMLAQSGSNMVSRALMGFGAGIFVAGGVAGLKESQAMERDRAEHIRAMAAGKTYDASRAPRREELKSSVYEMMSAKNAQENLHSLLWEDVGGIERQKNLDQNQINLIMCQLAGIDSRIELSNIEKIDLIGYSDNALVEVERTNLDLERYKTKIALREAFANDPRLGNFDTRFRTLVDANKDALNTQSGGINERDSAFKKIKRKNVWKAAGKGALTGLLVGGATQEIASIWNGQDGLVDGIRGTGSGRGATSLEWAREKIWGLFGGGHNLSNQGIITAIPGKEILSSSVVGGVVHESHNTINSFITLPKDYELNPSGSNPGIYDVFHQGKSIAHIEIDPNTGSLTNASLDELKKAGFDIDTNSSNAINSVTSNGGVGNKAINVQDFVHQHPDIKEIERLGWADNGTVRPDRNELKLWDPVEKNGQYEYAVKMNTAGSVFNGVRIDPVQLASEGKLKALFSLSESTQGHPVEVPIKFENGKMFFDVDPKDPILGQLFHKAPNGELICDARFVEVGAEMGSKNGIKEFVMCATEEGKGLSSIKDLGEKVDDFIKTEVKTDISMPRDIYLPPVIPIFPRTPLEPTKKGEKIVVPIVSPYYGVNNPEEILEDMKKKGIKPDSYFVKEIDGEAVWVDEAGKKIERSTEREQARVGEYLEKQEKSYTDELLAYEKQIGPMNEKCRVAVNIPARFEEKNLANLLTQYVKQVNEDGSLVEKDTFEINIIVNRKEGEIADKSVAIVEDWKSKNPGYHINVIDIEFPPEKANVGMARKYITDLTLLRSKNRSTSAGSLYIESEDADLFGIDKRTISKIIKGFDKAPHLDVLRGLQDRQPEILQKNDLLFFERRLWDFMEVFMRKQAYRPETLKTGGLVWNRGKQINTPEKLEGSSFVWNRVISGGWNTAFTAESYAQIGGYVSDTIGEDMKIGQKISMLRGHDDGKGHYVPNTQTAKASGLRASSSPRRFIDAMIKKQDPYANFEDQSLKNKTIDELMEGIKEFEKITPEQIKKYETSINVLGTFIGEQIKQPEASIVLKRTLTAIGLREGDYLVAPYGRIPAPSNQITLTKKGMDRIAILLTKYKESDKKLLGYRRQNMSI